MKTNWTRLVAGAALLAAMLVAPVGPITPDASAAVDPNLGPVAPPGETYCYAAADGGDRLAFIRMVGAPGDPGFTVQVDRLRLALGRSNIEALAIRPSGGLYSVDDASGSTPFGRIVPGDFNPNVDNDATTNATARGDFVAIANLNRGGSNLDIDVDGLTFIETDNLDTADDILLGAVRKGGNDTLITINPTSGLTSVEWDIVPPAELTTTPDSDGITNISENDVDDIGWDPESDIVYGVLGGGSLNYLGRLVWVLDDGAGGTTTSTTVPRDGGGAPDFSDLLRLNFIRIGSPAYNDVEGLGFSNVGATFGQFFGTVGDGGTDDDELLAFDKATGTVTSLIDLKSDAAQGTGNEDYEGLDCVQPVLSGSLTIGEQATPADGTRFTYAGGAYGAIGTADSNDGLADDETEVKTVNPGSYVISQDALLGWSLDDITCTGDLGFSAADWSIDLGAGELTVEVDAAQNVSCTFENSQVDGSIGDRVWLDDDADGVQDGSETGINGVTVTLRDSGGAVVATQETAGDGEYLFTGLLPGDYSVEVDPSDLPATASATHDLDGVGTPHTTAVVLAAAEDRTDVDFGYALGSISIDKTVYAGHDGGAGCAGGESVTVESGDEVTYCFVVTNTGAVVLSDVTVADLDLTVDDGDLPVLAGDLASIPAAGTVTLFYETTAANDLVNTATTEGTLPGGGTVSDDDTAEVAIVGPAIDIDKTVYAGHDGGAGCGTAGGELVTGRSGDAVTWCLVVTNTGETNLSAVTVTDPNVAIPPGEQVIALLTPGQSTTIAVDSTIAGDLTNTASVIGTSPSGAQPTDEDSAVVDEIHPALTVDKTVELGDTNGAACSGVEQTHALSGDAVTWCFTVTNTGDVDLIDVRLDDPALLADESAMTVLAGDLADLPVGGSVDLYLEGSVTADLANTVTATATPPVGPDVTDDDGAAVDVIAPAIDLQKSVYLGHDAGAGCAGAGESVSGEPGQPVTWCFVVTNAVDQGALFDIQVDDPDLAVDETDMVIVGPGDLVDLAEGESIVLAYEGTIDGDLTNTATATGRPPLGPDVTDDDDASVTELAPTVAIDKTVYLGDDAGVGCGNGDGVELVSGETGTAVTWCATVTNTGETDLSGIVFDDAGIGVNLSLADLAPGQSVTLDFTDTIDGDLVNTASVTASPPFGPDVTDEDTAEVDELAPGIQVLKGVYAGHDGGAGCGATTDLLQGRNGDPVTYCFAVTNTGVLDLDVSLEDLDLGLDHTDMILLSGSLTAMAPGQTAVLYVEDSLTADLVNTVEATGTTPLDDEVTDSDSAAVDRTDPTIGIRTTNYRGHDGGAGCEGDELSVGQAGEDLTYCYVITNQGDVDLVGITLTDPDLGIDESDVTVVSGSLSLLAPGGSVVVYLPTAFSVDRVNDATTTGTPPVGPDVSDTDPSEVDVIAPAISVTNTVYRSHDGGAGCAGGELVTDVTGTDVTYCFVVTNDGDTPLNVTLDDPDLGIDETDLTLLSGSLSALAPGASVTLYLDADIDGDLLNTIVATGTPLAGPTVSDDDPSEVDEITPAIRVDKTVYAGHDDGVGCQGAEQVTTVAGDAVTYCFVVTNTGDTPLDDLSLEDADLGITDGDMFVVGFGLAMLLPGDSITFAYETTVDGDLLNTVTADGRVLDRFDAPVPGPNGRIEDQDTAEVDEVHAALTIDKTVYGGHDDGAGCDGAESFADEAGRPVTWCFTVVNTGDTDLVDVTVDDADLGVDQGDLTVLSGSLALIPAGDTVTLYLEGTLDADLINTASATGTPPVGPDVSDEDDASVELLVGSIQIEKSVYAGHDDGASCQGGERVVGRAGDEVTWCFLVTNAGGVALDVSVDDPDVGFVGTVDDLAPGASTTLWFEGAIDGDLLNTATVTGETPEGDEVTDEDTAEVDEIDPVIQVEKTVYLGHDDGAGCAGVESVDAEVDAEVTWCFAITNTGDVDLVDIDLSDPVLAIDEADVTVLSGSLATLAPDATVVAYVEGTVDGDIDNTVTAGGVAPDDSRVTDDDTAGVAVVAPQIGIAKTVIDGPNSNGDGTYTLTYRLRVANAGETRLDDVQVTDDLSETFAGARSFRVDDVVSADLTVNDAYDGRPGGSIELLTGTDVLEVAQRGDIEVTVTVDPGANLGPYENIARTTGTSPGGHDVEDASDSGTDADPTAPNPDEPGDTGGTDDPVPVEFPAIDLTVVKTVGDVRVDGTLAVIDWRLVVTNDGPGDDAGPITVTDELDQRLRFVSATGEDWDCGAVGQLVTCVWNAPLAAGRSTSEIQLLTEMTVTQDTEVTNGAHVSSTGAESRTDNNDDAAAVTAEVGGADSPVTTLPRTGAAIGTLVLLGLGLVFGGRLLQRRGARGVA